MRSGGSRTAPAPCRACGGRAFWPLRDRVRYASSSSAKETRSRRCAAASGCARAAQCAPPANRGQLHGAQKAGRGNGGPSQGRPIAGRYSEISPSRRSRCSTLYVSPSELSRAGEVVLFDDLNAGTADRAMISFIAASILAKSSSVNCPSFAVEVVMKPLSIDGPKVTLCRVAGVAPRRPSRAPSSADTWTPRARPW